MNIQLKTLMISPQRIRTPMHIITILRTRRPEQKDDGKWF